MDIKDINKCFDNNIVPDCLNFVIEKNEDFIDYDKFNYIDYYEYEYYAKRFPVGFESLPGFDKFIQTIADKNKNTTPLKEMQKLSSSSE